MWGYSFARPNLALKTLGQIVCKTLNRMFIECVKADAMPLSDLHRASDAEIASPARLMRRQVGRYCLMSRRSRPCTGDRSVMLV